MFPVDEALRYLGAAGDAGDTRRQAEGMAALLEERIAPRYVWRVFDAQTVSDGILLPGADLLLSGSLARRMLAGCRQAALLICTLGAGFDAMLRTWQARDMAGAAVLDACGSAWVETGCDRAEAELAARYPALYLTDRFSPGYGDLPLTLQDDFVLLLDGGRRLGVTVTESHLLLPMKTVTAVIGLADTPQPARIRGCAYCSLSPACALQKGGTPCAK